MKSKRRLLAFLGFALVGGCVFSPAFRGGDLWDDAQEVFANASLHSWSGLAEIWRHGAGADYFPLKSTVQWLEWHAWGANPLGYHLLNVGLHVLSGFLFALLLGRLARLARDEAAGASRGEPWWAWFGGLLFLVHPLTVESVAWMAELKNTLSLPLLLLASLAYLDHDERGTRWAGLRSLLWFTAAMLSKSSVVMFPILLLLYGWWRRGRIGWRDFRATADLFFVALMLGMTTVWFQHNRAFGGRMLPWGTFAARALLAGRALGFYALKSVAPFGLLPIYPRWSVAAPSWGYGLDWLGLAALTAWLWRERDGWGRHALLGLGWFALNLLPVLGFVPMVYLSISRVADHFVYLSLLGVCGLAAAGLGRLAGRRSESARRAIALGAVLICVPLAISARGYAANFQNKLKLWNYTLERNPDAWPAHSDMAALLIGQGRWAEAIEHCRIVLRLEPGYAEAYNNLGLALMTKGDLPGAMAQYRTALAMEPNLALTHNNLANVLIQQGSVSAAIAEYRTALRFEPDYPDAWFNLGLAEQAANRPAEAVPAYREALRLQPDRPGASERLGEALLEAGRPAEAVAAYEAALELNPDSAQIHGDLGSAFQAEQHWNEAIAQDREAVRLKPDGTEWHYNLGAVLFLAGQAKEAAEEDEIALQLDPGLAEAHSNLGLALQTEGRRNEAEAQYREALRLSPGLFNARANLARLRGQPPPPGP